MECFYSINLSLEELQLIRIALSNNTASEEMMQMAADLSERFPEIMWG